MSCHLYRKWDKGFLVCATILLLTRPWNRGAIYSVGWVLQIFEYSLILIGWEVLFSCSAYQKLHTSFGQIYLPVHLLKSYGYWLGGGVNNTMYQLFCVLSVVYLVTLVVVLALWSFVACMCFGVCVCVFVNLCVCGITEREERPRLRGSRSKLDRTADRGKVPGRFVPFSFTGGGLN